MSSEKRVCLQCGGPISSMRRGKFCNRDCGDIYRKLVQQGGREIGIVKRECAAVQSGYVLFHNCIPGGGAGLDPFIPERCSCRKTVSFEKAKSLVARGEALDCETRKPFFNDRSIVQIGKLLRTPRSMSIEKANIQRSVEHHSTKTKEKTIAEMKAVVAQDKAWRDQEELERMGHYQFLTVQSMRIVQVPADQFDQEKETEFWRGRCLFAASSDDRTSKSEDVSEPKDSLLIEEAESDVLAEEDVEIEQHEDETENEDGDLSVVTVEEMEEVVCRSTEQ